MKTIAIYGRDNCPWCDKAKAFCEEQRLPFRYLDVRDKSVRDALMGRLAVPPRTVPVIFAGDIEVVGGCEGLMKAHSTGALQQILGGE